MATPPVCVLLLFAFFIWSLADPVTSVVTTSVASTTMSEITTTPDMTSTTDKMTITTTLASTSTFEETDVVTTTSLEITTTETTTTLMTTPGADQNEIVIVRTREDLVLDCFVDGENGVIYQNIYWLLDGKRIFNGANLSIANLNHTHHGSVIACYDETAVVQTRIIHFHHVHVLAVGETLMLNCTFDPTAATNNITWEHSVNGTTCTSDLDWFITNRDNVTSQLVKPNVMLEDTGVYSCLSSEGAVLKVFNISIGFYPKAPNFVCSSCSLFKFTCEWPEIIDTHLPTEVSFQYTYAGGDDWEICDEMHGNACTINDADDFDLRIKISNELGEVTSTESTNFDLYKKTTVPVPRITNINVSTDKMDIFWTLNSDCHITPNDMFWYGIKFRSENLTGSEHETETIRNERLQVDGTIPHSMVNMDSNTEYCIKMVMFVPDRYKQGDWSDRVCRRTLPTKPNVILTWKGDTSVQNEDRVDERDITFTWTVTLTNEKPFQGISYFEIEARLDDTTIDGTNTSVVRYDLNGRFDYNLTTDTFNYTIQGLSKYANYTISIKAVNSAGESSQVGFSVLTLEKKSAGLAKISGGLVAGLCILVIFLIIALLAFGFQRLKNNSKSMPTPVYHGNLGNIQPSTIETEEFDELPYVLKETQRQLLLSMSRESADSQLEDKGYRTSSTSSGASGGASGIDEKVRLLKLPSGNGNGNGNVDKSPYSVLSQVMPSPPLIQMAPDAVETDLDYLSPVGGHFSFSEEGLSLGGSSNYNQLESTRDTSFPNPYYTMVGMIPVRIPDVHGDSGYTSIGNHRYSSSVGCDDKLSTDDEISQPPTPALPNCSYFYSLFDHSKSAGQQPSSAHRNPCIDLPMSPQLRHNSENLATIVEGPDQYVLPSGPEFPEALKSDYVAHNDVFRGKPAITQHDTSNDNDPSPSLQSSPEHAVIIHPKTLENNISSHECIDGTLVSDSTDTPLNTSSFPSSVAIDNPVSSPARSNPNTPWDNGFVDSPPTSHSPRVRPNGNTGYVTDVQQRPLQTSFAVADTHPSKQPLQNHTGRTVLPTPSPNASGYVPITQMPKPVPTTNAVLPANTSIQVPEAGSYLPLSDTMFAQTLSNGSGIHQTAVDRHTSLDAKQTRENQSGYIPLHDLPSTNL